MNPNIRYETTLTTRSSNPETNDAPVAMANIRLITPTISSNNVKTRVVIKANLMTGIDSISKKFPATLLKFSSIPPIFGARTLYKNAIIAVDMKTDTNIPIGTPTTNITSPINPKAPKLAKPGRSAAPALAIAALCIPNANIGPKINIIKNVSNPTKAAVISANGTTGTFFISFKSSNPSLIAPILGTS